MFNYRANYYANRDDKEPSRSETFEAKTAEEAVEKAMSYSDDWMRVDVTISILKKSN